MERTSDYHTSVYVGGESTAFTDLREQLAVDLKIVTTTYKQWRTDLREREPSTDLRVDLERIDDV